MAFSASTTSAYSPPPSHHPARKPLRDPALFFHLLCPQPLATINLLSVSTNLPILDVPLKNKKESHKIHGLLCLVSFTECNVFKVSQLFLFCLTVALMCVSHRKRITWSARSQNGGQWQDYHCGKRSHVSQQSLRKGQLGGASQVQLPLNKILPSLLLHSLYPHCVCLYFSQLLVSASVFSSLSFICPSCHCFFVSSSLFCAPCIRGPNGLALKISSCGGLSQQ